MFKKIKFIGITCIPVAILLLLISCPIPLTKAMTNEVLDSVAPVITVLTPGYGDAYGAYTYVEGTVKDLTDSKSSGKVQSLTVSIFGITGNRVVPVAEDGDFSVTLTTNGTGFGDSGYIKLILTAVDWNNNISVTDIILEKASGGIVGFNVVTGNKTASLSWEPLPGAVSYTIKELLNRSVPVTGITDNSYVWSGLTNGTKYKFSIEAEVDGSTYLSSSEDIIPFVKSTLMPTVESVYRRINLSWKDISGAAEYVVERADSRDGPYEFWGRTTDPDYSDTNLRRGEAHFYRIYPVLTAGGYSSDVMVSSSVYACAGYFHGRNDYSILSSVDTGNSAFYTVISNDSNYAYIADGTDGLWIANILDVYNPVIISSCDTTSGGTPYGYGNARGVALSEDGSSAYIANNNSGMEIIDISNSSNPEQRQLYYTDTGTFDENYPYDYDTECALGIDVFDRTINNSLYHYACIGDGSSGIKVINVTDPLNLKKAWFDTHSYARRIVVDENFIYLADSGAGVRIYEIDATQTDSNNLTITEKPKKCYDASTSNSQDVAISGDYAYVAELGNGFNVFKISDQSLVGNLSLTNNALGVAVSGTRAYVANSISGLSIIDVSTLSTPSLITTCDTPGDAQAVTINGDYAFVTDYNSGLQIVDISEPLASAPASSPTTDATGIAVSGNYAFVSDGAGGMKIINISTPLSPSSAGSLTVNSVDPPISANNTGIAVSGNYAYVTDYNLGLHVFDILNPSNPVLKATCDIKVTTPGRSMGVAVSGSYAYVAAKDNGLQIVDISDPDNPVRAGLCDMDTDALNVAVSGNYAYVAGKGGGLIVMNISDPDNPYQVGSYNTAGNAYGIAVSGNYVYIADGSNGLVVLDVSTPESITDSSTAYTLDTDDIATGVTISGSYAFIADGSDGLRVIDISDPINLVEVTSANTTNAKAVAVAGRYAYVADGSGGLAVIDLGE